MADNYTDISKLPVGTEFWVINGEWHGEIVMKGGVKSVYMEAIDTTKPITGSDFLDINILGDDVPEDDDDDCIPF